MKRKLAAVALILLLLLPVMAGCTKKTDISTEGKIAMGRYVEQTIQMPEAVGERSEIAYLLTKTPSGQVELYCASLKENNGSSLIKYTLKTDHTWDRSVPEWAPKKGEIVSVTYDDAGALYAIGSQNTKDKVKVTIYKSVDGKNTTDITPEEFKEPVDYQYLPYSLGVISEQSFLLNSYNQCAIYQNGKLFQTFPSGSYKCALTSDRKQLMLPNEDMDQLVILDTGTGAAVTELTIPDTGSDAYTVDSAGNWYVASQKGLNRMVSGGSTWETIIDGSLTSMSQPSYSIDTLLSGEKEDFYIMYQYGDGYRDLKYYYYDKNIPSTPSQILTISSLNENATLRQAISEFQKTHQDIMIDYQVLLDQGSATTREDAIKLMNTELMAGKGTDLLVLDDMNVDYYIEKGVLADISSILSPMIDQGEILSNLIDVRQKGTTIYAAASRFMMPMAFGTKGAVAATPSLQTMSDYAKTTATLPLFGAKVYSRSYLCDRLYQLYSKDFLTGTQYDREKLLQFIEQLKVISDQTEVVSGENSWDQEIEKYLIAQNLYDNLSELGLLNVTGSYDVYAPIAAVEQSGGTYATIDQQYIPGGLIGMNASSKNKEIAGEFLKTLYSYEVQKEDLGDGLPVNTKALENFGMAKDDFHISGDNNFSADQPKKEVRQEIITLAKSLSKPIHMDATLQTMALTELSSYLSGDITAEEAADNMMEKSKLYLSE